MTEQTTRPLEPLVIRNDDGEPRWWFEGLAVSERPPPSPAGA